MCCFQNVTDNRASVGDYLFHNVSLFTTCFALLPPDLCFNLSRLNLQIHTAVLMLRLSLRVLPKARLAASLTVTPRTLPSCAALTRIAQNRRRAPTVQSRRLFSSSDKAQYETAVAAFFAHVRKGMQDVVAADSNVSLEVCTHRISNTLFSNVAVCASEHTGFADNQSRRRPRQLRDLEGGGHFAAGALLAVQRNIAQVQLRPTQ